MGIYTYDSGQHIFDRALWALWIAAKWILKAIVYLPLWFTGYVIATKILQREDSFFAWAGLIIIFAICLYQMLFFLKGMIIGFKSRKNIFWMPLFILCIAYVSLLPAWIAFDAIQPFADDWSKQSGQTINWIISAAFGCYVYSHYHFLTNISPVAAYPIYQFGIDTSLKLLKITETVSGRRSKQLF